MKHSLLLLTFLFVFTLAYSQQASVRNGNSGAVMELSIYPNPAVDYVQVSNHPNVKEIAIMNLAGRLVKKYNYNSESKYYVGNLPRGIYLIQFIGNENHRIGTRRLSVR